MSDDLKAAIERVLKTSQDDFAHRALAEEYRKELIKELSGDIVTTLFTAMGKQL